MNNNQTKLWPLLGLCAGLLTVQTAPGADPQASIKTSLAGVSNLELPSKTAGLIAAAPDQGKRAAAVDAVKVAVTMNPSAAAAIVSAVSAKVPSAASAAAATAAELRPEQAAQIARAASQAAPGQAGAIVAECAQKVPDRSAAIAVGASKGAPAANHDILVAASKSSPAPVRDRMVAAANAGRMMPVDVAIVHAYNNQGRPDIFDYDDHGRNDDRRDGGRGKGNDHNDHNDRNDHSHGNQYPGPIWDRPGDWHPRHHSGSCPGY